MGNTPVKPARTNGNQSQSLVFSCLLSQQERLKQRVGVPCSLVAKRANYPAVRSWAREILTRHLNYRAGWRFKRLNEAGFIGLFRRKENAVQNSVREKPVISVNSISRPRAVIGWTITRPRTVFLSLPISACSFLVIARLYGRRHQLLCFFAQLLVTHRLQASDFDFQLLPLFFQLAYFSASLIRCKPGISWRMASRRSLRRLISDFSISFILTYRE
ncbi:Uncharacterised protein [Cedecea neteri]|uniref:Uncharacterized protein n=1 Tax=Cedecea neteri TaxID=158822 RepID=A0A2X2TE02_9ENTR|nr:Uncharacterised protein [Cedecea neteri]